MSLNSLSPLRLFLGLTVLCCLSLITCNANTTSLLSRLLNPSLQPESMHLYESLPELRNDHHNRVLRSQGGIHGGCPSCNGIGKTCRCCTRSCRKCPKPDEEAKKQPNKQKGVKNYLYVWQNV